MPLHINETAHELPERLRGARLLDVIRDHVGLKGTKFGCGMGLCGACTVHVDGVAVRSCQVRAGDVEGRRITTIEGLAATWPAARLHPLQEAWIAESVPQCGYCQSGQIMAAASFLARHPDPDDAEIRRGMDPNLCRCGTYARIRRAVRRAAAALSETGGARGDGAGSDGGAGAS